MSSGGFGGRVRRPPQGGGGPRGGGGAGGGGGGGGGGRGGGRAPRQIRCPGCAWVPHAADVWSCVCGWAWNTFDTQGRCPGCGQVWAETECLRCARIYPHQA